MKNNFTKIILSLFLVFSIAGTLFSCDTVEVKETESDIEISNRIKYDKVKDYKIIETEKGYRLVFDEPSRYSGVGVSYAGFVINSWEEFSERLLVGELTFNEKVSIYETFSKDDDGYIIFDPYISYCFSHPMAVDISLVNFYHGSTYIATLSFEEECILPCTFLLHDYSYIKSRYEDVFDMLKEDEQNIEYEEEMSNGKKIVCYNKTITKKSSSNMSTEQYILSDGMKKIFVTKRYDYSDRINYTEDKKLVYIDVYGITNDDLYFSINFSNYVGIEDYDYEYPEEALTDEFLFGFDIEKIEK